MLQSYRQTGREMQVMEAVRERGEERTPWVCPAAAEVPCPSQKEPG